MWLHPVVVRRPAVLDAAVAAKPAVSELDVKMTPGDLGVPRPAGAVDEARRRLAEEGGQRE